MTNLTEIFGCMVFNEKVMQERLPKPIRKRMRESIQHGRPLDLDVADAVANAMKDWAVEKGVTHFTHWFQPMTGITAEKHDSFITPEDDGGVILEFSGRELIRGESDASSFPSGGLRATFEARGYTAWDPTSYAFIKDNVLCIPTAFCSYGGEALDKKTPLLRSMEAINTQAMRILRLFGTPASRVPTTAGAEQEYFLIDRELYNRRKDLIYAGRTLFGAKPPKGQELDDHYFGFIRLRISAYMKELNEELWKLGVLAKTEHNEAAPAQHELAPIFTKTNIATDHNQITMEIMRKVAKKHGMTCLLHEKPFEGVNGSGKHNNWSLATDYGQNLLEPGDTPHENAQFLTFLLAIIKAVDDYQDLLRISVASAGNDHRLGANEAPPAIISIFIGDELQEIFDAIESGAEYGRRDRQVLNIGVDVLPGLPRDSTDRNRTSPFAFTGNKFEFRMPGSAQSIGDPNTTLNTIAAEVLRQFADELEAAEDFNTALNGLLRRTVKNHRRIIFNGNGYDKSWEEEAARRGLSNYRTTPEAIPHLTDAKNVELFARHRIYTAAELNSRREIMYESYCKTINIEALTMLEMARRDIMPAVLRYSELVASSMERKRAVINNLDCRAESKLLNRLSQLTDELYDAGEALDAAAREAERIAGHAEKSVFFRDVVLVRMSRLRAAADGLEVLVEKEAWPYPSYGRLLYIV